LKAIAVAFLLLSMAAGVVGSAEDGQFLWTLGVIICLAGIFRDLVVQPED
jgi:hypothetical protein